MIYQEKLKDLFKMKNVDAVAHCIAQDAHMGAGVAVMFDKRYPGMKADLQSRKLQYPTVAIYDKKHNRPDVINLVTKPSSFRPPTYESFMETMNLFRDVVITNNYKTIAMPMIGAGLDRLNWKTQVLPAIHEMFDDLDVEITICFIDSNAKYMNQ